MNSGLREEKDVQLRGIPQVGAVRVSGAHCPLVSGIQDKLFLRSMLRGRELKPPTAATKWDAPWLLLEGNPSVGQQRRPWWFPDTAVTLTRFCLCWLLGSLKSPSQMPGRGVGGEAGALLSLETHYFTTNEGKGGTFIFIHRLWGF